MIKAVVISTVLFLSISSYAKDEPSRKPQSTDWGFVNKSVEERLSKGLPYMFCTTRDEIDADFNRLTVKFKTQQFVVIPGQITSSNFQDTMICALLSR